VELVQATTQGSDISQLAQGGIPCIADNSPFHMHHKFAIVDGRLLMNGSLNWTVQGVKSNEENVMITSDATMVKAFSDHFERLWNKFRSNPVR
jgi:mitochondrial cardiolipin hydrolase